MYLLITISVSRISHANSLMYIVPNNTIERFEPHGSQEFVGGYNDDLLDTQIHDMFSQYLKELGIGRPEYLRPKDYQPVFGYQSIDLLEYESRRSNDPGGFCAAWSVWYIDYRARYIHLDPVIFNQKLVNAIRRTGSGFKKIIRNYANLIIEISKQVYERVDLETYPSYQELCAAFANEALFGDITIPDAKSEQDDKQQNYT